MARNFSTMPTLVLIAGAVAVGAVTLVTCSSPTKPGVSVASARPASPANGTQVSYYSQPVTLVVANGAATGGGSPRTTVEIATDAPFSSIVATVPASPDGTGQLTVTLDHLSPATTYYWRVKTAAGDNPGIFTAPANFSIGPVLVIQAPAPVRPLADTFPHKRPTFTVANAVRTGPPATLTYCFDVAADAAFSKAVATGSVPEGTTQTSFTPSLDLTSGVTYYWRVQASDTTKGVISEYSPAQGFTTVFPGDGSFRYTLAVHAPSWCLTHYVSSGSGFSGCSGQLSWVQSDFSFDGTLVIDGDTLRYSIPAGNYFNISAPLVLKIRRTSNRLAGSISGTPADSPAVVTTVIFDGVVSGDADNRGRFEGTFDGRMALWRGGFPCDVTSTCSASGFAWTLTPH